MKDFKARSYCASKANSCLANISKNCKIVRIAELIPALSQSGEISPDFCCFYGGGIRHNEDIMHSCQNFIVRLIPNHLPPVETRIWKLVVRALVNPFISKVILKWIWTFTCKSRILFHILASILRMNFCCLILVHTI